MRHATLTPAPALFTWRPSDCDDAAHLAAALVHYLGTPWAVRCSEALIESAFDLLERRPRVADGYRLFLAAKVLAEAFPYNGGLLSLVARCREHGARVVLAVTGVMASDVRLIEAGSSMAYAVVRVMADPRKRGGLELVQ
jgi:hypothetical protein